MTKTITILGCGWLGLPLGQSLLADGYVIKGTTTSRDKLNRLRNLGILPYLISLSETKIEGDIHSCLADADVLIINIPPQLRGKRTENYVKKMELLHQALEHSPVQKVIFVSSTSVYGAIEGEVTEKTVPVPVTESGKQLLASEEIFRNDTRLKTTIIRFGGLIGPERHPVTFLSGKKNLQNGQEPINLIHRNDCIEIIRQIIQNNWWNEVFNGVYPSHPEKYEYYTSKAKEMQIQIPDYDMNSSKSGKIVHSYNLTNVKKYRFTTTL